MWVHGEDHWQPWGHLVCRPQAPIGQDGDWGEGAQPDLSLHREGGVLGQAAKGIIAGRSASQP